LSSDSWASLQSERERAAHASFVIDGKMFVAGGYVGYHAQVHFGGYTSYPEDHTNNVSSYDNLSDTWDIKKELPNNFGASRAFSINGNGYMGGGNIMERRETADELPDSIGLTFVYEHPNPLNYYYHYPYTAYYRGYCSDDEWFNVVYEWGDLKYFHPPGTPPGYESEYREILDIYGGYINTGGGFYYDGLTDVWSQGQCHPSYSWALGDWGNSEVDGKTKGMRLGGSQWGNSNYSIIDGLTDTWSQYPSPWIDHQNHKKYGGGSLGSEI